MALELKELKEEKQYEKWDSYVDRSCTATFFHKSGWKTVIETSFGHASYYFFVEDAGEIKGILPLVHVKSLLFGNALVSTPFCVYGGIVADDTEVRGMLEKAAVDLAEKIQVDHVEMRCFNPLLKNVESALDFQYDWKPKDLYVTFRKEIDVDPDVNMKAIPRKQRAMVRKGIKAGLYGEVVEGVEELYEAYSESLRNLGTPVFSIDYFRNLKKVFKDQCEILLIRKESTLVAGVMSFYFKDEVLPYYGGGKDVARSLKGNDFMYWDLMCRAASRGVGVFDYGRSKIGTGSYSFKKNWGFEQQNLQYVYYLVRSKSVPDINPLNPKYKYFIAAWKKLPLSVSRAVGPYLAKNLG